MTDTLTRPRRSPIVARERTRDAWCGVALWGLLGAGAGAYAIWMLRTGRVGLGAGIAVGAAVLLLSALLTWRSWRVSAVAIYSDRLVQTHLFGSAERKLSDIVGVRGGNGSPIALEMRPGVRTLVLPAYVAHQAEMVAWVQSLPWLDMQEAIAEDEQVTADRRLGGTLDERQRTLDRLRLAALWINRAALAVAAWAFVFPRPYAWAIGAVCALPLVAFTLCVWRPGLFTIVPRLAIEVRANLHPLIVAPAAVLLVRAFYDITLMNVMASVAVAFALAVPLCLALWAIDTAARGPVTMAAFLLVFAAMTWGGGVTLNAVLDRQPPKIYRATVIDRQGAASDDPRLVLDIPNRRRPINLEVSRQTFEAAQNRAPICAVVFSGRFGWRYILAAPCKTPAPVHD